MAGTYWMLPDTLGEGWLEIIQGMPFCKAQRFVCMKTWGNVFFFCFLIDVRSNQLYPHCSPGHEGGQTCFTFTYLSLCSSEDSHSKLHGANMGSIWGRQDPGWPHVGPMNHLGSLICVHNPLQMFSLSLNNIVVGNIRWMTWLGYQSSYLLLYCVCHIYVCCCGNALLNVIFVNIIMSTFPEKCLNDDIISWICTIVCWPYPEQWMRVHTAHMMEMIK